MTSGSLRCVMAPASHHQAASARATVVAARRPHRIDAAPSRNGDQGRQGRQRRRELARADGPQRDQLVRLLLVPVFAVLLATGSDGWAILVLAVSGACDWLDGVLARRLGQVSRLGQLLDPAPTACSSSSRSSHWPGATSSRGGCSSSWCSGTWCSASCCSCSAAPATRRCRAPGGQGRHVRAAVRVPVAPARGAGLLGRRGRGRRRLGLRAVGRRALLVRRARSTSRRPAGCCAPGGAGMTQARRGRTAAGRAGRPPDASMTLLTEVYRRPLDPGYAEAAPRRRRAPRPALGASVSTLVVIAVVLGLGTTAATIALRQPASSASGPARSSRAQIQERTSKADELQRRSRPHPRSAHCRAEVIGYDELALRDGSTLSPRVRCRGRRGARTADRADRRPDRRPGHPGPTLRVQDVDLQVVVNGLWAAGAEAARSTGTG